MISSSRRAIVGLRAVDLGADHLAVVGVGFGEHLPCHREVVGGLAELAETADEGTELVVAPVDLTVATLVGEDGGIGQRHLGVVELALEGVEPLEHGHGPVAAVEPVGPRPVRRQSVGTTTMSAVATSAAARSRVTR